MEQEQQTMDSSLFSAVCTILQIEKPANNLRSKLLWLLVKTIWLIVILFFSVLTIQMSWSLLSDYLQEPSVSNVNVMYNETFQLPKTTICLPLFAFEFDQITADPYNTITTTTPTYYQDEIEKYFNHKVTKEVFLNSYDSWPNSVLSVTLTHMVVLYGAEVYAPTAAPTASDPAMNYFWFNPNYYFFTYVTDSYGDSWKAAIKLETKLKALNVSIKEAKIALGRALQGMMKLNVLYNNGSYITQDIDDFEATTMNYYWACYVIDWSSYGIVFRSPNEYVEISMDGSSLPWKGTIWGIPMIAVDILSRFHIPISNNFDQMDTFDNILQGILGTTKTYDVRVVSVYQALPVKKNIVQCSKNKTLDVCRWECRTEMLRDLCNCTAAFLPGERLAGIDDCSMQKYLDCNLTFTPTTDFHCVQTCLLPCEQWLYNSELSHSNYLPWEVTWPVYASTSGSAYAYGTIRIAASAFDYPVFEEQYVWTTEDFAGAFGGLIGLWLGIDATIFIHFVFYCVTVVYGIVAAMKNFRKTTGKAKNDTDDIHHLKTVVVVPAL